MARNVKQKKVSYVVGASLEGPVYCEHEVVEQTGVEKERYDVQKKVDLHKGKKPIPRPNRRG